MTAGMRTATGPRNDGIKRPLIFHWGTHMYACIYIIYFSKSYNVYWNILICYVITCKLVIPFFSQSMELQYCKLALMANNIKELTFILWSLYFVMGHLLFHSRTLNKLLLHVLKKYGITVCLVAYIVVQPKLLWMVESCLKYEKSVTRMAQYTPPACSFFKILHDLCYFFMQFFLPKLHL